MSADKDPPVTEEELGDALIVLARWVNANGGQFGGGMTLMDKETLEFIGDFHFEIHDSKLCSHGTPGDVFDTMPREKMN